MISNDVTNHGEISHINLKSGHICKVNTSDLILLDGYEWKYWTGKRGSRDGEHVRAWIWECKRMSLIHRFIMGITDPKIQVDHRNGSKLDNTRDNLRVCTGTQNQGNIGLRSDNKSGYRGVSWKKSNNKWTAQFNTKVNGIKMTKYLGLFENKEDAASAYDTYARNYFGEEFARLNNCQ